MKITVIASLLFSILATILFFGQNLGISVILFVIPYLAFTIYYIEKRKKAKNRKAYLLIAPIILLAATYFIYQNKFFQICNIIVMLILYNIMLIWCMEQKYELEFVIKRIFVLFLKPFSFLASALHQIGHVFTLKKPQNEKMKLKKGITKQIMIGVGVSIPLLILIIALLSSADFQFANGISQISKFFYENMDKFFDEQWGFSIFLRLLTIIILTIYLMSFFINLRTRQPWKIGDERNICIHVDTVICNTVVTLLNIVYVIFCSIQVTNLIETMVNHQSIEYASYAREGFFQLMVVSIINFIIILVTTQNKKESTKPQMIYRKVMNLILAISTIIILISAFVRMNLYGEAYGYTFLRILVYFALITEGLLMIPTIVYIWKGGKLPTRSYFIIVVIIYLAMNFSNIPNMIATKNVNRYLEQQNQIESKIDILYLTKTKTDGLEEVIKLYETTQDPVIKRQLEAYFENLSLQLEKEDSWVEWNYSRWEARNLLEQIEYES